MSKIMIGTVLRCPANRALWMRTIIANGKPMTAYSKNKEELEDK